jgi:hypothetical protein
LVVLGLALAAAPVAFQMFTRAPLGAEMLADFAPLMTEERLAGFQTDIAQIDAAVTEVDAKGGAVAQGNADYQSLSTRWPTIHRDMSDLLDTVQGNRTNYLDVAALPSFRLFPWFFVVPGLLVAALGAALLLGRIRVRTGAVSLLALGVGLAAAPAAFQMFTRAPHGGTMMTAFADLETTESVARIQDYFSTMAVGQGAIRLSILPALKATTDLPAARELDESWIHILNDMTPMIGAMSDSVDNYQAIAALPPFPLFPYFFLVPGLLVAGLAVTLRPRLREGSP